jgi:ketosteroid isomerase-like protein
MRSGMRILAVASSLLVPALAPAQGDSASVVGAVAAFHAALEAGDSTKALSLLSDDVRIMESGGVEDKQKFRNGHLSADMAFAKAVKSVRSVAGVVISGTTAWVSSTSVATGESNGRAVNSQGAELMVLSRERDGWKIRAIHWSSRARRPQ